MRALTAEEMRQLDSYAAKELGLPELVLMENAGRAVADAAEAMLKETFAKRVVILAGKGNNGGDGLGAARWLQNRGCGVTVILVGLAQDLTGSAALELQYYLAGEGVLLECPDPEDAVVLQQALQNADLVIDALLGTGFKGQLRPNYRAMCRVVNQAVVPVLAVDIPSGVEADTGAMDEAAIRAQATVTMALPKVGLYLYPGAEAVGTLTVADIGMPEAMVRDVGGRRFVLTKEIVSDLLPLRPQNIHKGQAGRVTVAAGSYGYTGAAALSSYAAVKAGAGLVTLMTGAGVREALSIKLTEVMVKGLPEDGNGALTEAAVEEVLDQAAKGEVLAIGPGLGTSEGTRQAVRDILLGAAVPCVIDADALTALQDHTDILQHMEVDKVLTPHTGELSRLLNRAAEDIEAARVEVARECAEAWQATLVLKGVPTVVALPNGCTYLNTTGNPAMATGGCGDVLTGIIAGLIAQGIAVEEAALTGVYLHGMAGDMAAKGCVGLAAGELAAYVPRARQQVADNK